jgi:hypothetical protein
MRRTIDLAARIECGVARACRVLASLELDFVIELDLEQGAGDVRIQFRPVELTAQLATWEISLEPTTETQHLPLFTGELRAAGLSRGTDVRLTGTYRLSDETPKGDRMRAHMNACTAVKAFFDDIVGGVDTRELAHT